jgi:hypothetical protein
VYAFAVARAVHPSAGVHAGDAADHRRSASEDFEVWDAWALLGDPGDQSNRLRAR